MGREIWICSLTIVVTAGGSGVLAVALAAAVTRIGRRYEHSGFGAQARLCRRPLIATAITVGSVVAAQRFPSISLEWRRGSGIVVIAVVCWLLVRLAILAEAIAFHRMPNDITSDNRHIRRSRTQVAVLRRVVAVVAVALGVVGSLLLLPELHSVGASLFASAGLAGIVAGLAAQATLSNMFAGMQLAVTDALRIDDVVVVEGEWGWIEEITLTYVVVHIWDERRLVLPTSYFTTSPFQNWTRHQARLLGSIKLHLDFATPLTALREHARQVIENSPLWDGKDWVLQVTDTTETTMVVRVLASAKDGPTSWDLCCEIREALLVYLQEQHPQAMPVRRITLPEVGLDDVDDLIEDEAPTGLDLTRFEQGAPMPRRAELRRAEARRAQRRRAELVRPDPVRPEVVRPDVVRPESARPEVVRPERPRPERVRPEVRRTARRRAERLPAEPYRADTEIPVSRRRMPAPRRPHSLHGP